MAHAMTRCLRRLTCSTRISLSFLYSFARRSAVFDIWHAAVFDIWHTAVLDIWRAAVSDIRREVVIDIQRAVLD